MYRYFLCISLICLGALFGQTNPEPPLDPFSIQELPPSTPQENRFLSEFFYMLLMLGILVGLMIFATRFFKRMLDSRYDQMNESSAVQILERRQLSQKTTIYVIEIEGKSYVFAETPTTVVPLDQIIVPKNDKDNLQS